MSLLKKLSKIIYKRKIKKLKEKITSKKNVEGVNIADFKTSDNKETKEKTEKLFQIFLKEPSKLSKYIEGAKTKVYKTNLKNIQEGFILPQKGLFALYLNIVLAHKFSFKTSEIFVIKKDSNIYSLFYEFYRWYNYKKGTIGYSKETQEKFSHIFEYTNPKKMDTLSYDDIIELKLAIKKDIEAIDFIKQIAVKNQSSKKALKKLKTQGSANI